MIRYRLGPCSIAALIGIDGVAGIASLERPLPTRCVARLGPIVLIEGGTASGAPDPAPPPRTRPSLPRLGRMPWARRSGLFCVARVEAGRCCRFRINTRDSSATCVGGRRSRIDFGFDPIRVALAVVFADFNFGKLRLWQRQWHML